MTRKAGKKRAIFGAVISRGNIKRLKALAKTGYAVDIQRKRSKKRLFLLGEGYPWYHYDNGYYMVSLNNGETGEKFKKYELKTKWGAWQKVKLWIERVG